MRIDAEFLFEVKNFINGMLSNTCAMLLSSLTIVPLLLSFMNKHLRLKINPKTLRYYAVIYFLFVVIYAAFEVYIDTQKELMDKKKLIADQEIIISSLRSEIEELKTRFLGPQNGVNGIEIINPTMRDNGIGVVAPPNVNMKIENGIFERNGNVIHITPPEPKQK
ncbi:MAG: hypothetical protein AB7H77_03785 [Bdellovibrionales bacterium]